MRTAPEAAYAIILVCSTFAALLIGGIVGGIIAHFFW